MLKTAMTIIALVTGALALPAVAGNGPNHPAWKAPAKTAQPLPQSNDAKAASTKGDRWVSGDFEFVGGEAGWQLVQPAYTLANGAIVHADQCPFKTRTAAALAPIAPGTLRDQSPGA